MGQDSGNRSSGIHIYDAGGTHDAEVPICGFILWPGTAIADSLVEIDLFGHPRAFWFLSMAVNVLIYSGLFGVSIRSLLGLGRQVNPEADA